MFCFVLFIFPLEKMTHDKILNKSGLELYKLMYKFQMISLHGLQWHPSGGSYTSASHRGGAVVDYIFILPSLIPVL